MLDFWYYVCYMRVRYIAQTFQKFEKHLLIFSLKKMENITLYWQKKRSTSKKNQHAKRGLYFPNIDLMNSDRSRAS